MLRAEHVDGETTGRADPAPGQRRARHRQRDERRVERGRDERVDDQCLIARRGHQRHARREARGRSPQVARIDRGLGELQRSCGARQPSSAGDRGGDVRGVVADAAEKVRAARALEAHPERVQAGRGRDALPVHDLTVAVEHWARRATDTSGCSRSPTARSRCRAGRATRDPAAVRTAPAQSGGPASAPRALDVRVDLRQRPPQAPVGVPQLVLEVRPEQGVAAGEAFEPAGDDDAELRQPVEAERLAAGRAADREAGRAPRGREVADLVGARGEQPGRIEPRKAVAAAVAARHAGVPPDRERRRADRRSAARRRAAAR